MISYKEAVKRLKKLEKEQKTDKFFKRINDLMNRANPLGRVVADRRKEINYLLSIIYHAKMSMKLYEYKRKYELDI